MPLERDWDEPDSDDADELDEGPDGNEIAEEDPESPVVVCPACGAEVYEDADRCPQCGTWIVTSAGPAVRPAWVYVAAVLLLAALGLLVWRQLPF